jgi:signal transduction histidine kinase
MASMRERAAELGGRLAVRSHTDEGTELELVIS